MTKTITTRPRQVNPIEKRALAKPETQRRALEEKAAARISKSELQDLGLLERPTGPTLFAAEEVEAGPFPEEYSVTHLGIQTLHRHPRNRIAGDVEVVELSESIRQYGLQQPIKVRLAPPHWELPEGHYQIVFGERRWRAAKIAGLLSIPAHVVELDDAQTLELIAVENAARQDLDPMQKAELIDTLCTPIDEGGAGKTREEAAKVVGLKTGAAASNLVRLLELPELWRNRVAAGELPESFARLLLPYNHPELLAEFDKDYKQEQTSEHIYDRCWNHREALATRLSEIVSEVTGDCAPESEHYYGYETFKNATKYQGRYRCLIDLTEETRQQLKIVSVPVLEYNAKKRKDEPVQREVALNLKLFNKLQVEAIRKHVDAKPKGKGKATAAKAPAKPKPLTPAQLKQQAKEKAERYAKQLATWRLRWMRLELARQMTFLTASKLIAWLATSNYYSLSWGERTAAADDALGIKRRDRYDDRWEPTWQALRSWDAATQGAPLPLIASRLLWPSAGLDARHQDNLPRELIDELVADTGVAVEAAWFALQQNPDANRAAMFEAFFQLHDKGQLEQLGQQLDVSLQRAKSKADMVKAFLGLPRTLALPKCLQQAKAKPAAKNRRRKK